MRCDINNLCRGETQGRLWMFQTLDTRFEPQGISINHLFREGKAFPISTLLIITCNCMHCQRRYFLSMKKLIFFVVWI